MKEKFFEILLLLFIGFCLGNIFQIIVGGRYWKEQAVKHNAAEYVLTPENGEVTWRWKE